MKKLSILIILVILFLVSCKERHFNSEKWKTNKDIQYYMLNDLIDNKILIGKTKEEVISLLATTDIKQYNFNWDYWMFIIKKPPELVSMSKGVEVLDIEFENNKVKSTIRRK